MASKKLIPITNQTKTILGRTYYKAGTPIEWNMELWVDSRYIANRGKSLPLNGEITFFELVPGRKRGIYYLNERRNYKTIFMSVPLIDKLHEILPCRPEILILSTKIFNSLALVGAGEGPAPGIYIVAKKPTDMLHKTVVVTAGGVECEPSKIDRKIYFVPRLPGS